MVEYTITEGNVDNSFYIESTTGKIRVNNALDYEKITQYNLTIKAFDGIYDDKATVRISIKNVNDNPPVFGDFDKNPVIEEESYPKEGTVFIFKLVSNYALRIIIKI